MRDYCYICEKKLIGPATSIKLLKSFFGNIPKPIHMELCESCTEKLDKYIIKERGDFKNAENKKE